MFDLNKCSNDSFSLFYIIIKIWKKILKKNYERSKKKKKKSSTWQHICESKLCFLTFYSHWLSYYSQINPNQNNLVPLYKKTPSVLYSSLNFDRFCTLEHLHKNKSTIFVIYLYLFLQRCACSSYPHWETLSWSIISTWTVAKEQRFWHINKASRLSMSDGEPDS